MNFHESCLNGNVSDDVKERRVGKERGKKGGFKGRVGQSGQATQRAISMCG